MTATRIITRLQELAELYDGFVIDQWGVLHDGQQAYPGAAECLQQLSTHGKAVIILTNSGRRAQPNIERMEKLGFARDSYAELISSGEVAWKVLTERADPFYAQLGRRCYLVSRGGDHSIIEQLDLEQAASVDDADFILLSGRDETESNALFEDILARALPRKLPLICANPDRVVITPDGLIPGCATYAHRYQAQGGGPVRYIGKPYPEIYEHCRLACGGLAPEKLLAIGDSLEHDVAGGAAVGFATAFIMNGIHESAFQNAYDDASRLQRLQGLVEQDDVWPNWMLPRLIW